MKDVMVSIRMPTSLADELHAIAKEEGFLDVSELIRSVARKKWLEHTKPELAQLEGLRKGIESELQKVTQKRVHEEVAEELKKIRDQLKKGGLQ
jgi:Arc/MetJ-type ribon-helix-helix transcriptional regulator